MATRRFLLVVGFLLLLWAGEICAQSDRVLLKEVTALTLHRGEKTTGRRSGPMDQLVCVRPGDSCPRHALPDVVQCKQVGWDGSDAQWECRADLPSEYRFDHIVVICEGYDYPEDAYILRGSCALEYSLTRVSGDRDSYDSYSTHPESGQGFGGKIFSLFIVGIILYALYTICLQPGQGGAGGYGGAGRPGGYPGGGYPGGGYPGGAPPGGYPPRSGGGGGWWTGLATGGALGYLLRPRMGRSYGYGGYGGVGGYGGGYSSFGRSSFGRSTGSSFGGTRSSTGFGGTRRR